MDLCPLPVNDFKDLLHISIGVATFSGTAEDSSIAGSGAWGSDYYRRLYGDDWRSYSKTYRLITVHLFSQLQANTSVIIQITIAFWKVVPVHFVSLFPNGVWDKRRSGGRIVRLYAYNQKWCTLFIFYKVVFHCGFHPFSAYRFWFSYGGNCLEAPVYWYRLEPEKDTYDMSHVKELIDLPTAAPAL